MTKQEREQLKKELKQEILAELRKEKITTKAKGSDFNFEAYKNEVVADDINKAIEFVEINK